MVNRFLGLASAAPEASALIDAATGEITTRARLRARGEAVAAELTAAGVREGDAVAIQLPNSAEFVAAFLAILQLQAVAVPIDRDAPESEVGTILEQFGVKALLHRGGIGSRLSRVDDRSRPAIPEARLLKLTSGSTGKPKGIVTSERNLIADCEQICATMDIRPEDVNFGAIPFSHSYGFSNLVTPLLLQGTAVVMSNDYLPQSVLDHCNHWSCTVVPAIPMAFEPLLAGPAASVATTATFPPAPAPPPPSASPPSP